MPAVSKVQRRLAALALHNPEKVRDKSILSMSKSQLREFAETKESGLEKRLAKRGKIISDKNVDKANKFIDSIKKGFKKRVVPKRIKINGKMVDVKT